MSVVVTVETPQIDVQPGSSSDVLVRIRNTGDIVDRFTVTVVGDTSAWTSVTPPAVNLYPGAEETVRLSFAPARKPSPSAGRSVYGVFVKSTEHPDDAVTEEGAVTVLPFAAASAELVPQTSRGSGRVRHEVKIRNGGNVAVEAEIAPADPDRLLRFETRPPRIALAPGASGVAQISVTPVDSFLTGPPQSRPFVVTVDSSGQDPFELRGALLQSARLPRWLPRAVAGLVVFAVVGGALAATGTFPPRPAPSPSAPGLAVASATPSPTPSPTPTAPPSQVGPPSIQPSASAPLPSFSLSADLTPYVNSKFVFVCDKDPCQHLAISGMRLLATSLEAPYGGTGTVLDVQSFPDDSMPVVLEADIPFPWTSTTGGTGVTERVVVDFKPLMDAAGDTAYSFFLDASGTPHRFSAPSGLAAQVADLLFDSPMIVMPTPVGTFRLPTDWDKFLPVQPFQPIIPVAP